MARQQPRFWYVPELSIQNALVFMDCAIKHGAIDGSQSLAFGQTREILTSAMQGEYSAEQQRIHLPFETPLKPHDEPSKKKKPKKKAASGGVSKPPPPVIEDVNEDEEEEEEEKN